jgi:hypothetical protein
MLRLELWWEYLRHNRRYKEYYSEFCKLQKRANKAGPPIEFRIISIIHTIEYRWHLAKPLSPAHSIQEHVDRWMRTGKLKGFDEEDFSRTHLRLLRKKVDTETMQRVLKEVMFRSMVPTYFKDPVVRVISPHFPVPGELIVSLDLRHPLRKILRTLGGVIKIEQKKYEDSYEEEALKDFAFLKSIPKGKQVSFRGHLAQQQQREFEAFLKKRKKKRLPGTATRLRDASTDFELYTRCLTAWDLKENRGKSYNQIAEIVRKTFEIEAYNKDNARHDCATADRLIREPSPFLGC